MCGRVPSQSRIVEALVDLAHERLGGGADPLAEIGLVQRDECRDVMTAARIVASRPGVVVGTSQDHHHRSSVRPGLLPYILEDVEVYGGVR